MNTDDEAVFEPLSEHEQAMLDRLHKVEGPKGCHWINDDAQHCNQPITLIRSRSSYCEEHLRQSLTEKGWRKVLESVGRVPD